MTLKEWYFLDHKVNMDFPERICIPLIVDQMNKNRQLLWQLTDYRVSSACGIVIYMIPNEAPGGETNSSKEENFP